MINYLKDIKKETLIGQLPDIINSNNESIRNEFNWIFDSSLNRLTKSVYVPTGSVKAHFGEFVNLACEYVTIKNVDSLKTSIQSAVESVITDSFDLSTKQLTNHNILNHRFVNSEFEESNYMHDADAIVYKTENNEYVTVKGALDAINPEEINRTLAILRTDVNQNTAKINNASSQINVINTSVNKLSTSVNNINTSINSINTAVNKNINDIANVSSRTTSNINTLNSSVETLNSSVRNINSSISTINNSVNSINSSINRINNSITNINADITNINTSINNLKVRIPYNAILGNTSINIEPNQYYVWTPENVENVKIIKATINSDSAYLEEYRIRVICRDSVEHIMFTGWNGLIWENGDDPTQDTADTIFEFTIIDNYVSYKKYNGAIPPVQKYSVTYNANGGTGTMTDNNSPYDAGSMVTTLTNTFIKDGDGFSSWNTEAGGTGTQYAEGAIFQIHANTTLYAQWGSAPAVCDDINVIIDGADIYNLQKDTEESREYPTYVDYNDDYEYIPVESIGENEYLTIPTISNNVCLIFPSDNTKIFDTIELLDPNNQECIISFNPNDIPRTNLVYNDLFNCDVSCLYNGTIGSIQNSSMQLYYVNQYKIQATQDEEEIQNEYISGYIVIINDIINFADGILLDFEYNGELNYHYHIIQAKYPHMMNMKFEIGSKNYSNLAILTDENYTKNSNEHIYPTPTVFNGNIELYQQRYLSLLQLSVYPPEESEFNPDGQIIIDGDYNAVVCHINYTITGINDLDNIIKNNISRYFTGEYSNIDECKDNAQYEIAIWRDEHPDDYEYADFIYNIIDDIFNLYLMFGLNTINTFIGYDADGTRNGGFISDYYQNNKFAVLHGEYPAQTIMLNSEPLPDSELKADILPCHVILRWSEVLANDYGEPTAFDGAGNNIIYYGDNIQGWITDIYNPGIAFDFNSINIL